MQTPRKDHLPRPPRSVLVDVAAQRLTVFEEDEVIAEFPVSTSKYGLGSESESFRTPLGRFRVTEKIGEGAEEGTIFKGRVPEGQWKGEERGEDLVLTRILWLDGREPHNANTHDRYIYIHGTNQEDAIGTPASHGCVRMRNKDVVELLELLDEGAEVAIS